MQGFTIFLLAIIFGLIFIVLTGLVVIKLLASGKFRWPIIGVVVAYWGLYILGTIMMLSGGGDKIALEGLQRIGGATLLGLGFSAGIFYLFVIWSYKTLLKMVSKLAGGELHFDKIRKQHSRAMIVFFFTTWVAAGFVYLIHHHAVLVFREAKKNIRITPAEIDSRLSEVFGWEVDWKKDKKSKAKKTH